MRTVRLVSTLLLLAALLSAISVCAEDLQVAKVYRDYPGYINPAVCDNPNLDKAAPAAATDMSTVTPAISPAPAGAATAPAAARSCPADIYRDRSDDPVGHYLAVWGGMVATQDIELSRSVDMSTDNGYGAGIAIGYDLGRLRVEVEGSYRQNDGDKLKTATGDVKTNEELKVSALLVNAYADFATGGATTPYLGVGAGIARAEVDDAEDDVGVAQLAAGVLFAVSPQAAIDLGYRYLLPVSQSDFELRQHTALLGLQFRF